MRVAVEVGVGGEAGQKGGLLGMHASRAMRGGDDGARHVRDQGAESTPMNQRPVAQRQWPGALIVVEQVGPLRAKAKQVAALLQEHRGVGSGLTKGVLRKQQVADMGRHATSARYQRRRLLATVAARCARAPGNGRMPPVRRSAAPRSKAGKQATLALTVRRLGQ